MRASLEVRNPTGTRPFPIAGSPHGNLPRGKFSHRLEARGTGKLRPDPLDFLEASAPHLSRVRMLHPRAALRVSLCERREEKGHAVAPAPSNTATEIFHGTIYSLHIVKEIV